MHRAATLQAEQPGGKALGLASAQRGWLRHEPGQAVSATERVSLRLEKRDYLPFSSPSLPPPMPEEPGWLNILKASSSKLKQM